MFSNNSYLRTINRATCQLLTENKSETRRRRFIADDLSLRKIIRHAAVQCNEKRSPIREAGSGICGRFLQKYNKLHTVIRSKAHTDYMSICGFAGPERANLPSFPAPAGLTAAVPLNESKRAVANSSHRERAPYKQQRARFHGGRGSAYNSVSFRVSLSPFPRTPHNPSTGGRIYGMH